MPRPHQICPNVTILPQHCLLPWWHHPTIPMYWSNITSSGFMYEYWDWVAVAVMMILTAILAANSLQMKTLLFHCILLWFSIHWQCHWFEQMHPVPYTDPCNNCQSTWSKVKWHVVSLSPMFAKQMLCKIWGFDRSDQNSCSNYICGPVFVEYFWIHYHYQGEYFAICKWMIVTCILWNPGKWWFGPYC